jgi:L-rhamnose isomerase
MSYSIIHVPT